MQMKQSIVKNKSFEFAIRVVKMYQFLHKEKKEYVMSKQVLRAGTSKTTTNHSPLNTKSESQE
jgi:four helix bundle protein